MNYKLTLAYRGGNFCGWQIQPGQRSVQGVLTENARSILGPDATVTGCSRTDSGVHAKGFVALIVGKKDMLPSELMKAMNATLPDDIAVLKAEEADNDFHPRYSVKAKTYEYVIYDGTTPDPFNAGYQAVVHHRLDEQAMNSAALYLIGRQDFRSFMAAGSKVEDTIRTIYSADVKRDGNRVIITLTGDGFLYNMVRIIAGTLVAIEKNKKPASEMARIIESCDRKNAGMTFPPEGLFLTDVKY